MSTTEVVHGARQELEPNLIPIGSVTPHPRNPRRGDIPAIMASLEKFGQVRPILVQKTTMHVVAGNHTRFAAERLGWTHVAAVIVDLDDEEAYLYVLADNRLADRGKYEETELVDLMQTALDFGELEVAGYTVDDLEDKRDQLALTTQTESGTEIPTPDAVHNPKMDTAEAAKRAEPMRDIVLLMTVTNAQQFGGWVTILQKLYGTKTLTETVRTAISAAARAADADAWASFDPSANGAPAPAPADGDVPL